MTKPPFTPGPWHIYQHPMTPEPRWFDIFAAGDSGEEDIAENVTEANARLIAAAPDLHEALDWLLACVLADPASEVHPDDKEERLILACGAARTALAKANGQ